MNASSSKSTPNSTAYQQSSGLANGAAEDASKQAMHVLKQSKDFNTMSGVLKDMGVDEYEPRVINQLLEFSYRKLENGNKYITL